MHYVKKAISNFGYMVKHRIKPSKDKIVLLVMFTFIIMLLNKTESYSQPKYYWNENYGARSNLLGGQVIGSVENITAIYYNPGFLGLVKDAELIVGARMFEYIDYKVEFDELPATDLSSSKFTPSPGFIGGSFAIDSVKTHKFFYSILVREDMDYTFNSNIVNTGSNSPNGLINSNNILYYSDIRETWLGLAWAFSPIEKLGIGVTTFAAIRDDDQREETIITTIDDSGDVKINQYFLQNSYYNVRLLWKLGIYFREKNFTLGINLTTPSLNLFGTGESYLNIALSSGQVRDGLLITNYQEDLKSTYKNSYSIGAGGSYSFGKSKIHVSFEYFNKVDNYDLISQDPFVSQTSGDTVMYSYNNQLSPVINFGIGYQFSLTEKWTFYGSLFIDQNANATKTQFDKLLINMPLYHLTSGLSFTIAKVDITMGLEMAYGNKSFSTQLLGGEMENMQSQFTGNTRFIKVKGIFSAGIQF